MSRTWETSSVQHGTTSGHHLHCELKEQPCDDCYAAKAEYDLVLNSKPYNVVLRKLSNKAQQISSSQLRHNHPEEYKDLFYANKARLLVERAEELERARDIKP